MDGSPKVITEDLESNLIEVGRAIHKNAFDVFAHRVNKREHKISDIREYIERKPERFTVEQHPILMEFLQRVDMIIETVASAQTTKDLSAEDIQMISSSYLYWTEHDLLPKDALTDKKLTVLDHADASLAEGA